MSKVLVDRELLERTAAHLEWDGSEPMTTIQFAQKCDGLAGELRRSIAQPAEAEGVEVVGWLHGYAKAVSSDPVVVSGWLPECVDPLMTVAQHRRILSAVTAERDRLLAELERAYANYNQVSYASTERGKQIDQLCAEVETLRKVIRAALYYVPEHKHDLREIMSAAMAAKEA